MTDRLLKLREQRDLVVRHLEWLDQEIALAEPNPPPSEIAEPPPASMGLEGARSAHGPSAAEKPPATLPDPLEDSHVHSLKEDVRKGCLLYFGIAWLILLVGVGIIYLVYQ